MNDLDASLAKALSSTQRWLKERLFRADAKISRSRLDDLLGETTEADAKDFTSDLDETTICGWPYLLHRTSLERAESIIAERRMHGPLGWACFSVTPNQLHQAESRGAILFFRWTGIALIQETVLAGCLVHNFSPQYVESRIAHGPIENRLELIGIMHPDNFEETRQTRIHLLKTPIQIRVGL